MIFYSHECFSQNTFAEKKFKNKIFFSKPQVKQKLSWVSKIHEFLEVFLIRKRFSFHSEATKLIIYNIHHHLVETKLIFVDIGFYSSSPLQTEPSGRFMSFVSTWMNFHQIASEMFLVLHLEWFV